MRWAPYAACLVLTGCPTSPPEQQHDVPQPAATPVVAHPSDELAQLDKRTAVPLQPMMAWHQKQNMMEHLVAIQRITDGVAREDWKEVERGAALIESSPQMERMCQHMGAGAAGFTDKALEFHRRADAIGQAARDEDGPAVLRATSHTLKSCTGCHATFRQEVVDAKTWQQRTGVQHLPNH